MEIRRSDATPRHVASLGIHPITHWVISPDDRYLLASGTGAEASRAACIDLDEGREVASFDGATPVTALAWPGPNAWIVRSGATADATVEVHAPPSTQPLAVSVRPDLRALRHQVSVPDESPCALIARAELDKGSRKEPAACLGWIVDRATVAPLQPVMLRDLDRADVRVLGRHVAMSLSADGASIAAAFGQRIAGSSGGLHPGPIVTRDFRTGRTLEMSCLLELPAHEVAWAAGPTLVVRSARTDSGAHDAPGRVMIVDVEQCRVIFDSLARPLDPTMTSEHHLASTHADVHASGSRIVVSGHAMYVPNGSPSLFSHVHSRAYVVSVADGATLRTLDLEANPWDGVGALWRGDELDVLTCSSGHWAIARWTADGPGEPTRFDVRGVQLGGRLHRSPRRTRHVVRTEMWPGGGGHLTIMNA